jgi:hypothetical protein
VKIVRHYRSEWYGEEKEEIAYTDDKGSFEFAGVWKGSAVLVLHEPVIRIEVTAEEDGVKTTLLWVSKRDYSRFGELNQYAAKRGVAKLSRRNGSVYLEADLPK